MSVITKWWKAITHWEAWPFKLLYAPLAPLWVFYMMRARGLWFFSSSNPKITFGGMDGESKSEIYALMRKEWYPKTIYVEPGDAMAEILNRMQHADIFFPCVVKPDVACQGILFRIIHDETSLMQYNAGIPATYIIQEWVNYPMEVSVYHIRHPKEKQGIVTGFLHKIPLRVTGDGVSSLEQLVLRHPKAQKKVEELQLKHAGAWHDVIAEGKSFSLSHAGNHNRGAQFVDLKQHIDAQLTSLFDAISLEVGDFFYGRYDIMCNSVEDLKQGKNFTILEYNGCGAEPNHFYDTGYTLLGAYREILKHWKWLYRISQFNAKNGHPAWSFQKGRKFIRETMAHYARLRMADAKIP
jgi:hypothetical protein